MQLFAKFKKILRRGFRATLNFQKFKVALNPLRRIFVFGFSSGASAREARQRSTMGKKNW